MQCPIIFAMEEIGQDSYQRGFGFSFQN